MQCIKKQDAIIHVHSPSCSVVEYPTNGSEMSIAIATVTGRYPDAGYAINHKCTEMGYILKGSGKLVTAMQEQMLAEGDVVYIPIGEKYYWEGTLTILLPTAPAWSLEQHEVKN